MLANISVPLAGAVDTAVVGHLPDPTLIGAVGLGAVLFSLLYWAFAFLRMATTGFVAQHLGARRFDELHDTTARAVLLGAVLGIVLIIVQGPIESVFFYWLEGSDGVETEAAVYYQYRIWGAPAALINFSVLGVLFGLQRMGAALVSQLVLNVTNIVLDLVFVVGFGLGVDGVAIATVIAEYLAAIVGLYFVLQSLRCFGTRTRWPLLLDRARLKELTVVNLNLMVRTVGALAVFTHFTAQSAKLGDVILAVNTLLMHFFNLASYGLDGFAQAVEALGGHAVGRRSRRAFSAAVKASTVCAVVISVIFSLLFLITGDGLVAMLTNIDDIRTATGPYLPWVIWMPILGVWSFMLDGVFVGATRSIEMRNCMLLSGTAYLVGVWLLMDSFGNHGLWMALSGFMIVRAVTLAAWYPRLLVGLK